MKKYVNVTLLGFLVTVLLFSCKKDNTQKDVPPYEVKYEIFPIDYNFTKIEWTDAEGNVINSQDISQFQGGSKKITVSKKPFIAKLSAEINTLGLSQTWNYKFSIYINGEIKSNALLTLSPATGTAKKTIEYRVE
jgi:hypothetical protein